MARDKKKSESIEVESAATLPKKTVFVSSAKKDLRAMPEDVKDEIGQSLQVAEWGGTPDNAKPLKGARFRGVWEIVANFNTDTYRGVYTVRFGERVYVLHCFMKKSKSGKAMTQQDEELILQRLKAAESIHALWLQDQEGEKKS